MSEHASARSARWPTVLGTLCLVATLALLSTGVRVVRAEDPGPDAPMSYDPSYVEAVAADEAPAPPASRGAGIVSVHDEEGAKRPGVSGVETRPGVVVLNTRGFNYGPPPAELDAAALRHETGTSPPPAATD